MATQNIGLVAMRRVLFAVLCSVAVSCAAADQPVRRIDLDVAEASEPIDRFYALSVGSDYPGTLIREDSQAHLAAASDELGFKYLRFWEGADRDAYFTLYANTARTVKKVDAGLRVGGPSTAGAAWIPEFLAFCEKEGVPVDFVTTHTYGVDGGFLDEEGEQDTKLLSSPDAIVADVRRARQEIDASAFAGLPLYFTEWSSSYSPRDMVHDSYTNAPYVLTKLKQTKGIAQAMSYWAYTDLFEEAGPPPTPFHGGFGLMNREGVRKPTWFAYKYLNQLAGREIPTTDEYTWASVDGRRIAILAWDWQQPIQDTSNRPFYSRKLPSAPAAPLLLRLRNLEPGPYRLTVHRTGYLRNDPLSAYIDMGLPPALSALQLATLQAATTDPIEQETLVTVGGDGAIDLDQAMRSNDVVLLILDRQDK